MTGWRWSRPRTRPGGGRPFSGRPGGAHPMSRAVFRSGAGLFLISVAALGCVSAEAVSPAAAPAPPEAPQRTVDTTYVPPTGRTIAVPAGGDFQAALNRAQPGDVIT